jgi:serine protease AprX
MVKTLATRRRLIILLLILAPIILKTQFIEGQVINYKYFYRVYFTDKGNYKASDYSPHQLLSERAIARREKINTPVIDITDLPVNISYLSQVRSLGYTLHCTSKWMNTGLFKTENPADTSALMDLSFVKQVKIVKRPAAKSYYIDKLDIQPDNNAIPSFDTPLTQINGYSLHNSGFDGSGMIIAVLDGGFNLADRITSLAHLRERNGILGTRDIVTGDNFVYSYHSHGTAVMSVLAGDIPLQIKGTAPGASFWLIRTEDVSTEFPVEEDFWAAGAEFADSAGVDIISSSLGYYNFDDPLMNYKFSDMDGNTTFVSQAADFAASNGILVVASAGNERNKAWKRIIAPSDGNHVLAAGAVDGYNIISSFSSAGPSADRRIKPDNSAMGVSVPLQMEETTVTRANGTSFSCPVLSGISACAMQSVPEADYLDLIAAMHQSGHLALAPDSLYGYGIPDMAKVVSLLQDQFVRKPGNMTAVGPNPFTSNIEVTFREVPESLTVQIYNTTGRLISSTVYEDYISRRLTISDLADREQGMYIVRLITGHGTFTHKVIKVRN